MQTRSLRFRLTIWYTAVLTAGLALFGTLLWLSLRHELNADLERDLDGRAARFESFFRSESAEPGTHVSEELEEFCQALPPGSYINVRGSRGFTFRYPAGSPAQSGFRMLERKFSVNGEEFDLEVGAPLADIRHFLELAATVAMEPDSGGDRPGLHRRRVAERPCLEAGAGCDQRGAGDQYRESLGAVTGARHGR